MRYRDALLLAGLLLAEPAQVLADTCDAEAAQALGIIRSLNAGASLDTRTADFVRRFLNGDATQRNPELGAMLAGALWLKAPDGPSLLGRRAADGVLRGLREIRPEAPAGPCSDPAVYQALRDRFLPRFRECLASVPSGPEAAALVPAALFALLITERERGTALAAELSERAAFALDQRGGPVELRTKADEELPSTQYAARPLEQLPRKPCEDSEDISFDCRDSRRAEAIERFPSLIAPDVVAPGESFEASFALTMEKKVAGVEITGGTSTPEGKLQLPGATNADIRVVAIGTGLEMLGAMTGLIHVPAEGDSTSITFRFRAPRSAIPSPGAVPLVELQLYLHGKKPDYLGSVRRAVQIARGASARRRPPDRAAGPLRIERSPVVPDAYLTVVAGERAGGKEYAWVMFLSGDMEPFKDPMVPVAPTLSADLDAFYRKLEAIASDLALARPHGTVESRRREVLDAADELARRHVPASVRRVIEDAVRTLGNGHSVPHIQIVSDDLRFPWEMLPITKEAPLGAVAEISRLPWRRADANALRSAPPGGWRVPGIQAVIPPYAGKPADPSTARPEPWQTEELVYLRKLFSRRRVVYVPGTSGVVRDLLSNVDGPEGILHYVGHGATIQPEAGKPGRFVLELADGEFGADDLRKAKPRWRRRPLVFLNACRIGKTEHGPGFPDSWFDASLEAGASGFVGALWGLGKTSAGSFAKRFYEALAEGVPVARALHRARRGFMETGDPTYLAYVYYGSASLAVEGR